MPASHISPTKLSQLSQVSGVWNTVCKHHSITVSHVSQLVNMYHTSQRTQLRMMAKDGQERTPNAGFCIYLEFQAWWAKKQNYKLTFYDLQTCGLANSLDQIQWQWQEREISGENEENWELSWKRSLGRRVTDQFEVGNWHFAPREREREITVINSGEKLSGRWQGGKL